MFPGPRKGYLGQVVSAPSRGSRAEALVLVRVEGASIGGRFGPLAWGRGSQGNHLDAGRAAEGGEGCGVVAAGDDEVILDARDAVLGGIE